ncbi:MAG: NAD(P)-binding domain-containing protein [Thaumarchaeota archaeon]|nr:NAD(P)-binding domain-containing protein [Nitrososphaerota archaeon]
MLSIIGAGRVGSALAFLTAQSGLDDIVLYNRTKNKALGETLDVVNTIPETSLISVMGTDDISSIKNSDVVVITVSGGAIKEDRNELLPFNVPIVSDICKNLRRYADNAKIIIVTNPVDIITHQVLKQTEFPREHVIGIGSGLDSSRFRYLLSKELGTKQGNIEGWVMGEHGPTMVPLFSNAKFNGKKINLQEKKYEEISYLLRNYWKDLVLFKGASVFGAAKNTFDIVQAIIRKKDLQTMASINLSGEYGLSSISIGVPVIIGMDGVKQVVKLDLDPKETEFLKTSAKRISDGLEILSSLIK